jgi:hypothetical protein
LLYAVVHSASHSPAGQFFSTLKTGGPRLTGKGLSIMRSENFNFDNLNEALIFRLFGGESEPKEVDLVFEEIEFELASPLRGNSLTTEDLNLLKSMRVAWDKKLLN